MTIKSYLPRFSIRQLLAATAFIAVACVALRSASPTVTSASYGILLAVLAGSLLLVIYRQGANRAFWTGFAVCGWLYLLLLMYGWSLNPNTSYNNPLRPSNLITGRLSTACYDRIYSPPLQYGMGGGFGTGTAGMAGMMPGDEGSADGGFGSAMPGVSGSPVSVSFRRAGYDVFRADTGRFFERGPRPLGTAFSGPWRVVCSLAIFVEASG
jgi:hypothetical protein